MIIHDLGVRKIFDSRGEPTIEVILTADTGESFAAVPSGKSRGAREAPVLSFEQAVEKAAVLRRHLANRDFTLFSEWDEFLGEKNNLTLAASVAGVRLWAQAAGKRTWEFLADEFFDGRREATAPYLFANLINGGAHASNNLAIQEYWLGMPTDSGASTAVSELVRLYHVLAQKFRPNVVLGDEGGFALDFNNDFEPLEVLEQLRQDSSLREKLALGIDAAASNFYRDGCYQIGGKNLSAEELAEFYAEAARRLPSLKFFEDPFAESDENSFALLRQKLPEAMVIGDDLTVSSADLIKQVGQRGLINAVIIKPNQIGSVSAACRAIQTAKELGLKFIFSHRSGETADDFIVELARAAGAPGLKLGAPVRERVYKYNTFLRLYT